MPAGPTPVGDQVRLALSILGRGALIILGWILLTAVVPSFPGPVGPVLVAGLTIAFLATTGARVLRTPPTPQRPALRPGSVLALLAATALFAITSGSAYDYLVPSPDMEDAFDIYGSTGVAAAATLYAIQVGYGPMVEEFGFRGWYQRLFGHYWGRTAGIGTASALFAIGHWPPGWIPYFFVVGLIFGASYRATGRLLVPVLQHALFNAAVLATEPEPPFGSSIPLPAAPWAFAGLAVLLLIPLLRPGWVHRESTVAAPAPDRSTSA